MQFQNFFNLKTRLKSSSAILRTPLLWNVSYVYNHSSQSSLSYFNLKLNMPYNFENSTKYVQVTDILLRLKAKMFSIKTTCYHAKHFKYK